MRNSKRNKKKLCTLLSLRFISQLKMFDTSFFSNSSVHRTFIEQCLLKHQTYLKQARKKWHKKRSQRHFYSLTTTVTSINVITIIAVVLIGKVHVKVERVPKIALVFQELIYKRVVVSGYSHVGVIFVSDLF